MNVASMRIITDDVEKLASFYELISGLKVVRYTPVFASGFPAKNCISYPPRVLVKRKMQGLKTL